MANNIERLEQETEGSFMKPNAYKGKDIEFELMESGLDIEHDSIYIRLSADGYLDCTDWHGPYDDLESACGSILDLYFKC